MNEKLIQFFRRFPPAGARRTRDTASDNNVTYTTFDPCSPGTYCRYIIARKLGTRPAFVPIREFTRRPSRRPRVPYARDPENPGKRRRMRKFRDDRGARGIRLIRMYYLYVQYAVSRTRIVRQKVGILCNKRINRKSVFAFLSKVTFRKEKKRF